MNTTQVVGLLAFTIVTDFAVLVMALKNMGWSMPKWSVV